MHGLDTRNKNKLYLPVVIFFCVQKGVSYSGIKHVQALYRVIEMTGKDTKISYADTLLFIPFIQLLKF